MPSPASLMLFCKVAGWVGSGVWRGGLCKGFLWDFLKLNDPYGFHVPAGGAVGGGGAAVGCLGVAGAVCGSYLD